jgi:hypothetical protein
VIGDPHDLTRRIRTWGSDNPSFDALMLLGPVVVFAVVLAGRNVVTTAMAVGYVAAFVVALAANALEDEAAA